MKAAAAVSVLVVVALLAAPRAGTEPLGLPASVAKVQFRTEVGSWPVLNPDGTDAGSASWRLVRGTGNCCENYLTATREGRLLDLGGSYVHYTDDAGQTWYRVTGSRVLSAEGAISAAPGGDVVGITWDPYSGDRIVSYLYDGDTDSWLYAPVLLHTPFFDRPWLVVVPGPVRMGTQTAPYAVVIMGGYPSKDLWYVSLDGLNYVRPTSPLESAASGKFVPLQVGAHPDGDVVQPHTESGATPLNGRGLLSSGYSALMDPSLAWSRADLPGSGRSRYVVDAAGRIIRAAARGNGFRISMSSDEGMSWSDVDLPLPEGLFIEDWDLKSSAGVVAIAAHTHDEERNVDQDIVLRARISDGVPVANGTFFVGDGDLDFSSGLGADLRFDFASLAILPDGAIATSFVDDAHRTPSVAILLSDPLVAPEASGISAR